MSEYMVCKGCFDDVDCLKEALVEHGFPQVEVHETAQVFGDIAAANISVMDGAQFEGNAKIQKTFQEAKPEPKPPEKRAESSLFIEDEFIDE